MDTAAIPSSFMLWVGANPGEVSARMVTTKPPYLSVMYSEQDKGVASKIPTTFDGVNIVAVPGLTPPPNGEAQQAPTKTPNQAPLPRGSKINILA